LTGPVDPAGPGSTHRWKYSLDRTQEKAMPEITPFLWYDNQAEEAANFYASVFPDARVLEVNRGPDGTAFMVSFEIEGQRVLALNGGPDHTFSESFSFFVNCAGQDQVDEYWAKLTADGGEEGPCGWCKDRFGLSWQVIPAELPQLLGDPDPERAARAGHAMRQMRKIDVQALRDAADGKPA
jgi:predicted 3-demethylubiquinone-9 3-methyltransferase (glyoxalase superfamily)